MIIRYQKGGAPFIVDLTDPLNQEAAKGFLFDEHIDYRVRINGNTGSLEKDWQSTRIWEGIWRRWHKELKKLNGMARAINGESDKRFPMKSPVFVRQVLQNVIAGGKF